MPQPTAADVHRDVDLSNIAIGYKNLADRYIADKVYPIIETDKISCLLYTSPSPRDRS